MREHVVASSKAMKRGDWKKCKDYMLAVKVSAGSLLCYFKTQWDRGEEFLSATL